MDPLGIRKRYPAAVFIPIEQIDEALARARRATTLHNKRIGLFIGRSRLARPEHNAQGLSVPELPDLRRRVSMLQCEVNDLTRAQAAQIAEKARLESLPLAQQCQELGIRLPGRPLTVLSVLGRLRRSLEQMDCLAGLYSIETRVPYCSAGLMSLPWYAEWFLNDTIIFYAARPFIWQPCNSTEPRIKIVSSV